jgi:hypothetical protein
MKNKNEVIESLIKEIQNESFAFSEMAFNDKNLVKSGASYQDVINVFLYKKLAEFECRLRKLELDNICRTDNVIGG